MKIEITWSKDHYRADLIDLPGTPPVGLGRTPELAVACLWWTCMRESTKWLEYINLSKPIIVNGETWDWPKSYYKNGEIGERRRGKVADKMIVALGETN